MFRCIFRQLRGTGLPTRDPLPHGSGDPCRFATKLIKSDIRPNWEYPGSTPLASARRALLCLSLAAVCAAAGPKPIAAPAPVYPAELTGDGRRGLAVIDARVLPDGTVADLQVRRADHPAFGAAALAACQTRRFAAAGRDASPAGTPVSMPFEFIPPAEQQFNAHAKRRVYQPLPEEPVSVQDFGGEPKVRKKIKPSYPRAHLGSRLHGDVMIDFIVAPDGRTLNPEVRGRPWPGFIPSALDAVAAATYEPPVKDGRKVYVAMTAKVHLAPPPQNTYRRDPPSGFGPAFPGATCGAGCSR